MKKEELIERYDELYTKMKHSQDVKNMKIFGKAEKYMFHELAGVHPDMADRWLSHLEAICWDNFLSKGEAMNIGKRITNEDGTKGFHWNHDVFTNAVTSLGGIVEEKPYYNWAALWLTTNMIYSDYANILAELLSTKDNELLAQVSHKMAVKKLKDLDRPCFIRDYFHL
jgi:hypothetical protein